MKKLFLTLISTTLIFSLTFSNYAGIFDNKAEAKFFETEKRKFYDYKSIGLNELNTAKIDKMVDDWLEQNTSTFGYGAKSTYTQDEWEKFNTKLYIEANGLLNKQYELGDNSLKPNTSTNTGETQTWTKKEANNAYDAFVKVINNFNIKDKQIILNYVEKNKNDGNALTQTFSLINQALEEQYGDNIISVDYYSGLAIIGKIQKEYYVAHGTIKNYSNKTYTDISVNFSVYNNSSICGPAYAFCNSLSPNQTWQFTTSCGTENWTNLLIHEVIHD